FGEGFRLVGACANKFCDAALEMVVLAPTHVCSLDRFKQGHLCEDDVGLECRQTLERAEDLLKLFGIPRKALDAPRDDPAGGLRSRGHVSRDRSPFGVDLATIFGDSLDPLRIGATGITRCKTLSALASELGGDLGGENVGNAVAQEL